jgi:hypothetical protein
MSEDLIFVSIASYRDKELGITVFDILNKANNPKNVVLSILSQDKEENHPNLDLIFSYFKVEEYFYKKIHFTESTGVGFARAETQKYLSDRYRYYLQVDSHSQFVEDWDIKLVEDYETKLGIL